MSILPASIRERFHVPGPGPYLQSHSAGALPVAGRAALEKHVLAPWQARANGAWDSWLAVTTLFRERLATLIETDAADIVPVDSVTTAFQRYLSALTPTPDRNVIVMAENSFPSLGYAAQGLATAGWRVRYVAASADPRDLNTWDAAVGADTAVVLIMHSNSFTGALAPVEAIAALAHTRGARCVVDCAQSLSIVPVAPSAWGVDAAIGSCLKWSCGGPGAGWLWVAPEHADDLSPALRGWWSHAEPFAMDMHDFLFAPHAARFWGATPTVAPFALAAAGLAEIAAIGLPAIRAHNQTLQAHLVDAVQPSRAAWRWPDGAIGGTLCIDVGSDRPALESVLKAAGVTCDFRGTTLRLSFHAYNSVDDVDAVKLVLLNC